MSNRKEVLRYSESQVRALRDSVSNIRVRVLIGLLYETGCRVHEAVSIHAKDLDLVARTVVFKNRKSKVSARLARELRAITFNAPEDHVFATRQSSHMTTKRARQLVKDATEKHFGESSTPMALRYSHVAHALDRGVCMSKVQRQIGLQKLRAKQLEVLFSK